MKKVIIAGSRDFRNYQGLCQAMDRILKTSSEVTIISGKCPRGADKLGERYAEERGYQIELYPADWSQYRKRAGYLRNEQMAEVATHCVCFWDGISQGTSLMINIAKRRKLPLRIVRYSPTGAAQTIIKIVAVQY